MDINSLVTVLLTLGVERSVASVYTYRFSLMGNYEGEGPRTISQSDRKQSNSYKDIVKSFQPHIRTYAQAISHLMLFRSLALSKLNQKKHKARN